MPELLTICVPTYNRPEFLAECLKSIFAQTFQDFQVVVLDNASDKDNNQVLAAFKDPRLIYRRRKENIGPAGNINSALRDYRSTPYLMVFHDDDIMHPRLLEYEIGILEKHPEIAFVASGHAPFVGQAPTFSDTVEFDYDYIASPAKLAYHLLMGAPVHFGSVVYRTSALNGIDPDRQFRSFSIIADRPLLLDVAESGGCAMLRSPLVWYRIHPAQDTKSGNLTGDHVIELYSYYKEKLGPIWSKELAEEFFSHTGVNLVGFYRQWLSGSIVGLPSFLAKCKSAGILKYWDLRHYFSMPRWAAWFQRKMNPPL